MQRVLFINRSYYPDCEATGQLLTELCEDLAADFDVSVICGQPNKNPDDAPYQQYGTQQWRGVKVTRVRHTRFDKAWRRRWRAFNMITFLLSATWSAFFRRRPDTVIVETDPPLLCVLGFLLQRLRGCRLVVYLQDIYPDVAVALHQLPPWFPAAFVRKVFYGIYKGADQVVVLSEDMRNALIESGVDADRIQVIPNWVDTRLIKPIPRSKNLFRQQHGINGQFMVMYSGNMGLSQRFDSIIAAAEQLKDNDHILFAMVGDGAKRKEVERWVEEKELTNVRFFDYQPKSQLSHSLSAADLQLVLLAPKLQSCLMPSKLYSILAVGGTIMAISDADSELAKLVTESEVGVVCESNDVDQIAATIEHLASDPEAVLSAGQRGRELALEQFDRGIASNRFADMLGGRKSSRQEKRITINASVPTKTLADPSASAS